MNNIDLVVPYVDSSDTNWQKLFDRYNPFASQEVEEINAKNRFRGQGDFFEYFFKGVKKYASWIRYIFLILQSPSQKPTWIDKYENVKIVYHEDFIPKEYLPTFNSTCIEMFIPFIPDLSEKFLYANDDTFIYNYIHEDNFFQNDFLYLFYSKKLDIWNANQMYLKHCVNGYRLVFPTSRSCPLPNHTIRGYIKSICIEEFAKNRQAILSSITRFRTEKNINMYFYDFCMLKRYKTQKSSMNLKMIYSHTKNIEEILNSCPSIICIQDTSRDNFNIYEDSKLPELFELHFEKNINTFTLPEVNKKHQDDLRHNDALDSISDITWFKF